MSKLTTARSLLAVFVLFFVSCTSRGGDFSDTTETAEPTSAAIASEAPDLPGTTDHVEVWFTEGERLSVVYEKVEPTQTPAQASLELLLRGEPNDGVSTAIPEGVELNGVVITEGTATADFSRSFEAGGGTLQMTMRLAQVVFTLTQFPSVEGVNFEIEGKRITTFSGEGIDVSRPQTRKDFEDNAPAIVVTSPKPGQRLSSQVLFAGEANVFEATVSLRLVDRSLKTIKQDFTTATCGTGCRGTFSETLDFSVKTETQGFAEVFESSAQDGAPRNVVQVPVVLVP